jgi:hypothetical protein
MNIDKNASDMDQDTDEIMDICPKCEKVMDNCMTVTYDCGHIFHQQCYLPYTTHCMACGKKIRRETISWYHKPSLKI